MMTATASVGTVGKIVPMIELGSASFLPIEVLNDNV
jgi:hypothetical protein